VEVVDDQVEVVDDQGRVRQRRADGVGVGGARVDRDDLDALAPVRGAGSQSVRHRC